MVRKRMGMLNGVELGAYVLQNNIRTTLNLNNLMDTWSDVLCDPDSLAVSITLKQGCEDRVNEVIELLNNKSMHCCSNHKEVILRYKEDSMCTL